MENEFEFEEYLRSLSLKESSIKKYLVVFRNIPSFIFDSIEKINRFIADRSREYNDAVLYFAVIRHYLRMKGKHDWVRAIRYPRIKRIKRSPTYLNLETIYKILENIPDENYKIAGYVQLFGGMRSFEVMQIRRKDINVLDEEAIITIRTAKRDPYEAIIIGTGFRKLKEYLEKHDFRDNDLIFCKKTNSLDEEHLIQTNIRYYQEAIKTSARDLGYTFRSHDLKRNLARFLRYEKGLEIEEVKEALHHSQIDTTLRYVGKVNKERIVSALKYV